MPEASSYSLFVQSRKLSSQVECSKAWLVFRYEVLDLFLLQTVFHKAWEQGYHFDTTLTIIM